MMRKIRYTPAASAWRFMKEVHESFGHKFEEPSVDEFTFVGTKYTSSCRNCGKVIYVSGGWGGPSSFGPGATATCSGASVPAR
jgi:hypothetical protein